MRRIARGLDVPLQIEPHAAEVDAFLEAALHNHRASDAELDAQVAGAEGARVRELYQRMLARRAAEAERP